MMAAASAQSEDNTIRFSFDSESSLYSEGARTEVEGVLPELMSAIFEQHMGLEVVSYGSPWMSAQHRVKTGQLDALVTNLTERRAEFAHASSQVVLTLTIQPVIRRDSPLEGKLTHDPSIEMLHEWRGCYAKGNGWAANFMAKHGLRLYGVKDNEACMRMISRGRMDFTLQASEGASRMITQMELIESLEVHPNVYDQWNFKLLVRKTYPDSVHLLGEFDKALEKMKSDGSYGALVESLMTKHLRK